MKGIMYPLCCMIFVTSLLIFSCDNTEDDDEDSPRFPATVIVENASSFDITGIYAVLTSEIGWGDNYITSDVLSPGKTLTIVVPPDNYKFRIVTTDPPKHSDTTKNLKSGKVYLLVIHNTFIYRSMNNESDNFIEEYGIEGNFETDTEQTVIPD